MDSSHKNIISDNKIVLYGHWKRFFSILLAVLAGLSLVFFLFLYTFKTTLTNPEFYKNNLKKADTYSQLINDGIPAVIMKAKISDTQTTNLLAKEAIVYVIKKTIPPSWVEKNTEKLIDKTANFLAKPHQNPEIILKLDELGGYMGQIGDSLLVLEQIIPSCTQAQSDSSIVKQLFNVSIDCKNMDMNLDQIKQDMNQSGIALKQLKITELNLTEEIRQAVQNLNSLRKFIQDIIVYMWVALILFILFALLIILLQRKSIYHLVKYLSWTILISSGLALLFGLTGENWGLKTIAENVQFSVPSAMQTIIDNFTAFMVKGFFAKMIITSGVFFIIGVLTLIATYIYSVIEKKQK